MKPEYLYEVNEENIMAMIKDVFMLHAFVRLHPRRPRSAATIVFHNRNRGNDHCFPHPPTPHP